MLLSIISTFSSLLPLGTWILGWRKGFPPLAQRLGLYVLLSATVEISNWALIMNGSIKNNLPVLHVYTLIEIGLLLWCFSAIIRGLNFYLIVTLFLGFVALEIWLIQDWQPLEVYNTVVRSLESVLFILLSVIYFAKTIWNMHVEHLTQEPEFWFCTALLLYFSGNLIIFGFSNMMNQSPLIQQVWILHSILNLVLNGLFSIGLWKAQHKTN